MSRLLPPLGHERIYKFLCSTRMHSSKMRTARSSSRLLGVVWGVCLSACWDTSPGVGLETPPPLVWIWRPPLNRFLDIRF